MVKFAFAGVVVSLNENSRASKDEARASKANDLARGSEPVSKLYPIFIGAPVLPVLGAGNALGPGVIQVHTEDAGELWPSIHPPFGREIRLAPVPVSFLD